MKDEEITAHVSRLPYRNGDGYSYGGEVLVTIGNQSFFVGGSTKADEELAREICRRWNAALREGERDAG